MKKYIRISVVGDMLKISVSFFCMLVGILMLFTVVISYFEKQYVETAAIVVNQEKNEEKWKTYLKFQVNDKEYTVIWDLARKENIGAEIVIFYNPEDPRDFRVTNENTKIDTIFTVFGLLLTLLGISEMYQGIANVKNK